MRIGGNFRDYKYVSLLEKVEHAREKKEKVKELLKDGKG